MSYLEETRSRSFCGACEAGVEHECRAYGRDGVEIR